MNLDEEIVVRNPSSGTTDSRKRHAFEIEGGTTGIEAGRATWETEVLGSTCVQSGARPDNAIFAMKPLSAYLLRGVSNTAGDRVAIVEWDRYLSSNTGVTVAYQPPLRRNTKVDPIISWPERLLDILRLLGVSKTELKDICGVSRQTLYDWLGGKFQPDGEKASRLRDLHELARLVGAAGSSLRSAVLKQPIADGKSLLDLLSAPRLDMALLREVIAHVIVSSMDQDRHSAREILNKLGFPPNSRGYERRSLDENLRGFDRK